MEVVGSAGGSGSSLPFHGPPPASQDPLQQATVRRAQEAALVPL